MAGGGETKDFNWLKHESEGNESCHGIEVNGGDEEIRALVGSLPSNRINNASNGISQEKKLKNVHVSLIMAIVFKVPNDSTGQAHYFNENQ